MWGTEQYLWTCRVLKKVVGYLRPGRLLVHRLTMFTITFLPPPPPPPPPKIQLFNTLTKQAMLLFFFVLPEQQGYRDNPLRRVVSAILKNTRQNNLFLGHCRSFAVISGRFSHVISGRFLIGK